MGQNSETFPVTTKYAPYNYEISKMSKSFPFVVDAKVDILHKDMNKIMEKLDVILSRHHGNQVRTKYSFPVLPTVFTALPSKSVVPRAIIMALGSTFHDLPNEAKCTTRLLSGRVVKMKFVILPKFTGIRRILPADYSSKLMFTFQSYLRFSRHFRLN